MRPRRRYLRGNKGTEGPTSLLFFDTESQKPDQLPGNSGYVLKLRLWVACHVRREGENYTRTQYYRGHTAAEFWSMVESLLDWKRPLWGFAHNLGYDLTQLLFWDELERFRFTSGPVDRGPSPKTGKDRAPWRGRLVLEGRPTFLILRNRGGVCRFVDTGNYWPSKLEAIGEKHGLPKLTMPPWEANDEHWFNYCTRDVDVCRVAVCELIRSWIQEDCGVFRMTAASLAMTHFQHKGTCRTPDGKHVNIVLEDKSPARPIERRAFLGGRIEPFYIGRIAGPVICLDANSLYLSAMSGNLFPRKRARKLNGPTPKRLREYMRIYGAIADILINTRAADRSYPVRRDGLQLHACGRFWTTLCGPELIRALDAGDVEKVAECHLYSLARLFAGWADYWHERKVNAKRSADLGEYEFCKLIGTSLAGKFGQRGEWWVDAKGRRRRNFWGYTHRTGPDGAKAIVYRYVAGHVQKRVTGEEPDKAFPAISAYITAYAREYMRSVFGILPKRSLLYTATDSVVCLKPGYDAMVKAGLVDEEALGLFHLEGTYTEAEICGPNWYRVGDYWTCSGMHGRAVRAPNGEPVCEVWDQLPGRLSTKPDGTWTVRRMELRSLQPAEKNMPAGDGWRMPMRLSPIDGLTDRPPWYSRGPIRSE